MNAKPKHTPEPWRTYQGGTPQYNDGVWYVNKATADRIEIASLGSSDTDAANAARIVACVNACAGLDPDALGELIAAVEMMQAETVTLIPRLSGRYATNLQTAYDALRAALAKVKS